ncbi:MAG: sodium:solute symporter family protein [Bacteriovoracales bacterium]|nr:sodium:solute symporter family protein [Bacteriovoracales bacterium]
MNSHIVVSWALTDLDWIVFSGILLLTLLSIAYGHLVKKPRPSGDGEEGFLELLLMGRRLTLPMFVATLVATWYGGIFGVTAIAFEQGLYNFITQGVFWYLTYILFALWLVDKVRARKAATLADLVGEMFGPSSRKLAALFNFLNVVPVTYAIALGIFLQMIFHHLSFPKAMILGTGFVAAYSMYGGLRSVVYSDLIQFFVMCSAVFLVALLSVSTFGGLDYLRSHLPPLHFSFTGGESLGSVLAWGLIALSTLVDPNFYQRSLAASSSRVAKRGIFISTLIWLLFDLSTTFGAMYAKASIPNAQPDRAYLIYALQILPDGLRGFFLAGLLATILSTMDSYFFIAGSSLTYDLVPKRWRRPSLYPVGIVGTAVLACGLGLLFDGHIKNVWKTLGSYSASCLLLPVVVGHLFPGRLSDRAFFLSCTLGILGTTWWRLFPLEGPWQNLDELYVGSLFTLFGIAASFFLSGKKA